MGYQAMKDEPQNKVQMTELTWVLIILTTKHIAP
jgi:hypothetical protein